MKKEFNLPNSIELCPYCLGTGKLKAMQRALINTGGSTRAKDKAVKCNQCDGTGRKTI